MSKDFDLKQWSWSHDIESFSRNKAAFQNSKHPKVKEITHRRMTEIQKLWPQYIKPEEVPQWPVQ